MASDFAEMCDVVEEQNIRIELHHVPARKGSLPNKFRLILKRNQHVILDLAQARAEPLDKLARNAVAELKGRGILYDEHND